MLVNQDTTYNELHQQTEYLKNIKKSLNKIKVASKFFGVVLKKKSEKEYKKTVVNLIELHQNILEQCREKLNIEKESGLYGLLNHSVSQLLISLYENAGDKIFETNMQDLIEFLFQNLGKVQEKPDIQFSNNFPNTLSVQLSEQKILINIMPIYLKLESLKEKARKLFIGDLTLEEFAKKYQDLIIQKAKDYLYQVKQNAPNEDITTRNESMVYKAFLNSLSSLGESILEHEFKNLGKYIASLKTKEEKQNYLKTIENNPILLSKQKKNLMN